LYVANIVRFKNYRPFMNGTTDMKV